MYPKLPRWLISFLFELINTFDVALINSQTNILTNEVMYWIQTLYHRTEFTRNFIQFYFWGLVLCRVQRSRFRTENSISDWHYAVVDSIQYMYILLLSIFVFKSDQTTRTVTNKCGICINSSNRIWLTTNFRSSFLCL